MSDFSYLLGDDFPEQREGLRSILLSMVRGAESYRQRMYPQARPESHSRAATEMDALNGPLAEAWSDNPVTLVYGAAELHMGSAQEHLAGLALLLPSGADDALMTLARGVVEAAARASWLLDPSIDARVRVARCMTERLAGLHEELRMNRLLERETDAANRVDAIAASAERLGYRIGTDRRRRRYVGADPYPGSTAAVVDLFKGLDQLFGARAYADLSAVAHSQLAAFAYPLAMATAVTEHHEPPQAFRAVVIAQAAYDIAMRHFLDAYSWSPHQWKGLMAQAHADMRRLIGIPPGLLDLVRV